MTIGIDASALLKPNPTGVEKYARFLLDAMMAEPLKEGERVVLLAREEKPGSLLLPSGWSWKTLPFSFSKGWTHLRLSRELFTNTVDVFFSPAHEVPFATGTAKVVTTIHDVAFAKAPKLYSVFQNIRQRMAVKHAVRTARTLLAVSESTKHDLETLFAVPKEKILVTPLASTIDRTVTSENEEMFLKSAGVEARQYFLFIGRIEEKKNVGLLIEAFETLKKRSPEDPAKLVLVGSVGFGGESILARAKSSPVAHDMVLPGYVSDEAIVALTKNARAFCFLSKDEGFGLPVLDAMRLGAPVLVSDIPVFHEVAGSAALYVSPTDPVDAATKMLDVSSNSDLWRSLVERGFAQVEKYSWEKTAAKTWEALRSV